MFLAQVMFLTRIPVPSRIEFSEDDLVKGVIFAPLAGILIGLLPAAAYYLLSGAGLIPLAAASAVVLNILLTGGLHLDGLADTADGFFSYRNKERILEIMKDSRIGTNGALALVIILLMKFSIILSLIPEHAVIFLVITPAAARMTIAWSAGLSPYARNESGMGKAMVEKTGIKEILFSIIITAVLVAAVFRFSLIMLPAAVVISAAGFAFIFSRYSLKKIGGMTGDVIGAVIELTEVVILALLLAFETIPALTGFLP